MPNSLQIALTNDSDLNNVHAYITGIAIQQGGKRCFLQANGKDLYFPQKSDAPEISSPIRQDCAISLGPPGNTVTVTIPQIAGGRIWIAEGKLTFLLNPGPEVALVEPSVLNPSDPNHGVNFGFAEFTLNDSQLYANISYVDFVARMPIGIALQQASGQTQTVSGMAPDGLDKLANAMENQTQQDNQPWDQLVVKDGGKNLRILNATHGNAVGASFDNYFTDHVEEVWQKYASGAQMAIDTQAGPGVIYGNVNGHGDLVIGDEKFSKPNSADILGCNSGPFTTGPSSTRNAIIPRLAAAFARTCLLDAEKQPSHPNTYYKRDPTNHYARLVHMHNLDGKGYAFAYDDVQPDEGNDQSGKVNAGDPVLFTVAVGGKSAASGLKLGAQRVQASQGKQPYNRPPPPPPPGQAEQWQQGLKDKAKGFAQKILK